MFTCLQEEAVTQDRIYLLPLKVASAILIQDTFLSDSFWKGRRVFVCLSPEYRTAPLKEEKRCTFFLGLCDTFGGEDFDESFALD